MLGFVTNFILFWLQGNSLSSSRCSTPTAQVTKVTANLAFKVEVHAPHVSSPQIAEPPTRPVSSASRRSSRSSSRSSKTSEAPSNGGSVHSSLSDSLRSSLSSSSGQDFDNNGDAGFSEKWKSNQYFWRRKTILLQKKFQLMAVICLLLCNQSYLLNCNSLFYFMLKTVMLSKMM